MRRLALLPVVVGLVLATAGAASAHANLVATTPGEGASLERAPSRIVLRFDEPVETVSGAVRVYTVGGDSVPVGVAEQLTDLEVATDLLDPDPCGRSGRNRSPGSRRPADASDPREQLAGRPHA